MTWLRIASYNTRDFLDNRAAAARVVRALGPDVLCLQEVPRRLFAGRRVAGFAAETGLTWVGGHRGSGGTTVFTGPGIRVGPVGHHRLGVRFPDRTRGYAVVSLRLPGRAPLVVASVHLGLKAPERARHAQVILTRLGEVDRLGLATGSQRTVVCGDLNEDETGAAWQLIGSGLRLVSPPGPTFPSSAPRKRLDVVFASPDVVVLPHRGIDLPLADLVAGSDHRPVWVDVDV